MTSKRSVILIALTAVMTCGCLRFMDGPADKEGLNRGDALTLSPEFSSYSPSNQNILFHTKWRTFGGAANTGYVDEPSLVSSTKH